MSHAVLGRSIYSPLRTRTVRAFTVVTVSPSTDCVSPFGRVSRSTNRRRYYALC
jgi:hypothetical protein